MPALFNFDDSTNAILHLKATTPQPLHPLNPSISLGHDVEKQDVEEYKRKRRAALVVLHQQLYLFSYTQQYYAIPCSTCSHAHHSYLPWLYILSLLPAILPSRTSTGSPASRMAPFLLFVGPCKSPLTTRTRLPMSPSLSSSSRTAP